MLITVFHTDHGVTLATLDWALAQIQPTGFFLRTLTLPDSHVDLENGLYGPSSGDAPIQESEVYYAKRTEDRPESRMITKGIKRATRLITLIGMCNPDGSVTVFTAYGGPAAEREPNDPTLRTDEEKSAAAAFWAVHAIAAL